MLTDRRTDGWMDEGQKVIIIAHPEHSSGELKILGKLVVKYVPVHLKKKKKAKDSSNYAYVMLVFFFFCLSL